MQTLTASYSPEDNKLRLYASSRLDADTYKRVKEAGFKWAPKQDLFVAPMWTPSRADLLIELCGEIGDEDTSLVDRAEERADRFDDYSISRIQDANRAHAAVESITSGIPFGQPILVGHHSEARARKDAQRIENGMRKAVQMWDTAQYWKSRAAGALRAAKYKELPAVRARRIKGLEADKRKQERSREESAKWLNLWSREGLTHEEGLAVANQCWLHLPRKEGDRADFSGAPTAYDALTGSHPTLYAPRTLEEVIEAAKDKYPRFIEYCTRWINHFENRIAYERAMLDEQGGLKSDNFNLEIGGRVLTRGEWAVITRINRKDGAICSVSVAAKYSRVVAVEDIKDYKEPEEGDAAAVKSAIKLDPLCNYPVPGCATMTQAEYKAVYSDHKGGSFVAATDTHAAHRVRMVSGFIGRKHGATVQHRDWHSVHVFLSDAKLKEAPKLDNPPPPPARLPAPEKAEPVLKSDPEAELRSIWTADGVPEEKQNALIASIAGKAQPGAMVGPFMIPETTTAPNFEAMREQLKQGVQVVSAPQLFPTPRDLAERMADMLDVQPGDRVLEPSAGTGMLLGALGGRMFADSSATPYKERNLVHAVEINRSLAGRLQAEFPLTEVHCTDFLAFEPDDFVPFDKIIMNPPFVDGADIAHITHAVRMLNRGGRLVAICANGPRQNAVLRPLVEQYAGEWEVLPPNTFAASGTSVSTVLLSLNM